MDRNLLLVGRILFSIPYLMFGINHFRYADMMSGMVPLPGGAIWIYVTGACQILAAISFLSGKQMRLAGILTAVLMLIYVFSIHLPGMLHATDAAAGMMSMTSLLKDIGLAGGALILASAASHRS